MGPKKGRRVRKIEVNTNSVPEFQLGDMVAGGRRVRQGKGRKRHRNRGRNPGGRKICTQQRRDCQKSVQGQTKVTQKWIHAQRVEERRAHLSHT